jgi:hypothetical protein
MILRGIIVTQYTDRGMAACWWVYLATVTAVVRMQTLIQKIFFVPLYWVL